MVKNPEFGVEIGDTGTVKENYSSNPYVDWDKLNDFWAFNEDELELCDVKPTTQELLELPIGTKITTDLEEDNAFVKFDENSFINQQADILEVYDIEYNLLINVGGYGTKIIKIEVPDYKTIYDSSKEVKEMTIAEISKALGYEVKIVREEE